MKTILSLCLLAALWVQIDDALAQEIVKKRRPSSEALKNARSGSEAEATTQVLATIDSMLVLIEAGEIEALLARYIYPPDVEQALSEQVTLDMLAQRFKERGAERLKTALKEAKTIKPEWNDELDKAYFEREGKDIIFVRYKGQWYLRN